MIFCHKCGAEQLEGSEFCRKCGAKLLTEDNNNIPDTANTINAADTTINTSNSNDSHTNCAPTENEPSNKKKVLVLKAILIIVSILVLAAIAGIVVILMTNNKANPEDTNSYSYSDSNAEAENALDATYSSKENEISFNYPSNWEIDEECSDSDCVLVITERRNNSDNSVGIELFKASDNSFGIQSMSKDEINKRVRHLLESQYVEKDGQFASDGWHDLSINSIEKTTFGGFPAIKADYTAKNKADYEFHNYDYYYDTNSNCYQWRFSFLSTDLEAKSKMDKIIDSAKVTIDETQTEPKTEAPTEKPTEKKTEKATEKPTEKPTEPSLKAKDLTGIYNQDTAPYATLIVYGTGDTVYIREELHPNMTVHSYTAGYGKLKTNTVKCELHSVCMTINRGTDVDSDWNEWEWISDVNCSVKFDDKKGIATVILDGSETTYTKNYDSTATIAGEVNIDSGCLNVRNGDSTDADVVGTLNKGDKVLILDDSSDWYVVVSDDVFGFVYGEYIKTYS